MNSTVSNKVVILPIILAMIVALVLGINAGMKKAEEEITEILPSYDDTVNWEVISFDEAMNHWDDDQAILFYAFNDCPYCTAAKPVLGAVSYNNADAVSIYYVDVSRGERVEGNETYDLTLDTRPPLAAAGLPSARTAGSVRSGAAVYMKSVAFWALPLRTASSSAAVVIMEDRVFSVPSMLSRAWP